MMVDQNNEPLSRVDSLVHLIYHDPSDQKITDPDPDHLKRTHPSKLSLFLYCF